ncbi:protein kinase family protein [Bisgaard Taxon 46]
MELSQHSFEDYVYHLVETHKGKRIHSFEYGGHLFWLKQPEVLGTSWRLIKPNPNKAFQNEINTLINFAKSGAPVPQLLLTGEDFLVLKDAGPTLADWVENPAVPENEKQHILSEGLKALLALHQKGLVHGRPAIRDMAWNGKQIRFIDLETHHEASAQKQVYDLVIFIHSLCRSKVISDIEVKRIVSELAQQADTYIWQQVLHLMQKYRFLYYLLLPFKPIARTDLIAIYRLFENMSFLMKEGKVG